MFLNSDKGPSHHAHELRRWILGTYDDYHNRNWKRDSWCPNQRLELREFVDQFSI